MTGRMQMLRQFLVGAAVSACNIMIHALVMIAVVRLVKTADKCCGEQCVVSSQPRPSCANP